MIVDALGQSRDSFESIYAKTEATGQPPLTFKGTPVQYEISGNLNQDGTPTPTDPIYPQECGDRTENLFDGYLESGSFRADNGGDWPSTTGCRTDYIGVTQNKTYTVSVPIDCYARFVAFYGDNKAFLGYESNANEKKEVYTFDTPYSTKTIRIVFSYKNESSVIVSEFPSDKIMLNEGSTALPYEPYGYRIPLTLSGVTQNLFLSEPIRKSGDATDVAKSDNTAGRRIKKLVLTGNENWSYDGLSNKLEGLEPARNIPHQKNQISSHYIFQDSINIFQLQDGQFYVYTDFLRIKDTSHTTVESFKAYLADQYAAGTPVTVWYALETETTETVTSPTLTTSSVQNTLSVDTALPPSSVHVQSEYEIAEIYSGLNYSELIYLKTQTLTGNPPFTFKSYPGGLMNYQLFGDSYQDGVPDPDHPVEVVSGGDKTDNLYNRDSAENLLGYINANGSLIITPQYGDVVQITHKIPVVSGKTYWICNAINSGSGNFAAFYDVNNSPISVFSVLANLDYIKTAPQGAAYFRTTNIFRNAENKLMFVESEEFPTSYIHYGYKIPITCGGVTQNIYLGECESTRRIKKRVLTGEETFTATDYYNIIRRFITSISPAGADGRAIPLYCSHFIYGYDFVLNHAYLTATGNDLYINREITESITDFKSFLAAEYSAGHPVTIWYVLAEPETSVVNEPLHKIGEYADTITMAQASVTIPTIAGTNTLTIDTTVQPSSVSITGHIKPTGYGQLLDVNGVDIQDKNGTPIFIQG